MKEFVTYSPKFQRLVELWQRSDNLNDSNAQFNLACCLLKINNCTMRKKAFALFKKLANQSYSTVQTDAQYMLGQCYENGYGIQKSYPRAIRWYKIAGHNIGRDLCPIYKAFEDKINKKLDDFLDDLDSRKITPELVDFIIGAAEGGDVEAQKRLMYIYKYDKTDDKEAAYWAQTAAENGDVDAIDELGRMYYYGQSVERNFRKGLDLMEKAAKQGCASSAYHLGLHYEKMKANKKAAEWFRKYAEFEIKWRNKKLGWKRR